MTAIAGLVAGCCLTRAAAVGAGVSEAAGSLRSPAALLIERRS